MRGAHVIEEFKPLHETQPTLVLRIQISIYPFYMIFLLDHIEYTFPKTFNISNNVELQITILNNIPNLCVMETLGIFPTYVVWEY